MPESLARCTSRKCHAHRLFTWRALPTIPDAARTSLARVGWNVARTHARSLDEAMKLGGTFISEDCRALVSHPAIDVIVEYTGNPIAAVEHCLARSITASMW